MFLIFPDELLILKLLLFTAAIRCEDQTVTAYEGGSVSIHCSYDPEYKENIKYFCSGECLIVKNKLVKSGSTAEDRRFKLTDNTTVLKLFTVTITDLRTDDSGQYWCGIETHMLRFDKYSKINLVVKHVTEEFAVVGQNMQISCHQENAHKNQVKFFCKGEKPSACEMSGVKVSSVIRTSGRYSLSDSTVTVANVSLEDSGIYWCGIKVTGEEATHWTSVHRLHISEENGVRKKLIVRLRTSPEPSTSGFSITRTSSLSSSSLSSSVVSLKSDASTPKPESGILAVSITLALLLMMVGLSLLLFFFRKTLNNGAGNKAVCHDPASPTGTKLLQLNNGDQEGSRSDETVVYEEISEHNTYALAGLPNSIIYSSIKTSSKTEEQN